jgi:hypothetical protein
MDSSNILDTDRNGINNILYKEMISQQKKNVIIEEDNRIKKMKNFYNN